MNLCLAVILDGMLAGRHPDGLPRFQVNVIALAIRRSDFELPVSNYIRYVVRVGVHYRPGRSERNVYPACERTQNVLSECHRLGIIEIVSVFDG